MGKVSGHKSSSPSAAGASTSHPAQTGTNDERNEEYIGQFTQVLSNRARERGQGRLQPLRVRERAAHRLVEALAGAARDQRPPAHHAAPASRSPATPTIRGTATRRSRSVRDDFTFSYDARGRHDLKAGRRVRAPFRGQRELQQLRRRDRRQQRHHSGRHAPGDLSGPVQRRHLEPGGALAVYAGPTRSASAQFPLQYGQPKFGPGLQDDWRIGDRLTLNLGLRYDLSLNAWANEVGVAPFYAPGRPNDANNIQPRLGFAYQMNDRTVMRGGSGSVLRRRA